jgi:hypothetical protein
MYQYYSRHKISEEGKFSFKPSDYSKFKYGDDQIAEQFGKSLAQGFIEEQLSKLNKMPQLVVVSSPYAFIPTATFAMKNYFVFELNRWLAANDFPVLQEIKIHRTTTYKADYGQLTATERLKLIGNDKFYMDKHFLENKTLIILDDIKITGTHEVMIKRTLKQQQIQNAAYFLYFAELINPSIHPNIENYLNNYTIKTINDLGELLRSNRFSINTRIVKFMLNTDTKDFQKFIKNQNNSFCNLLYDMAIGNEYHKMKAYNDNLKLKILKKP